MTALALALWLAAAGDPIALGGPGDPNAPRGPGDPPCPEYLEALTQGAERQDAFDDAGAAAAFERALGLDPEAVEARFALARVLNAQGEAATGPEAEAFFARALRFAEALRATRPDQPESHYWVAATNANLIAFRDAPGKVRLSREIEAAARRALAIDPCFVPAYAVLGITYRELSGLGWFVRGIASGLFGGLPKGSLEDAERLLAVAIDLDPDDPFVRYQLALTLERRKKPREAMAQLQQVLELPPRTARDLRLQSEAVGRLARLAAEDQRSFKQR